MSEPPDSSEIEPGLGERATVPLSRERTSSDGVLDAHPRKVSSDRRLARRWIAICARTHDLGSVGLNRLERRRVAGQRPEPGSKSSYSSEDLGLPALQNRPRKEGLGGRTRLAGEALLAAPRLPPSPDPCGTTPSFWLPSDWFAVYFYLGTTVSLFFSRMR